MQYAFGLKKQLKDLDMTQPPNVHNAYKATVLTGVALTGFLGLRLVSCSIKNSLALLIVGLFTDAALKAGNAPGLKTPSDYLWAIGNELQNSTVPNAYHRIVNGIDIFKKYDEKEHLSQTVKKFVLNASAEDQKKILELLNSKGKT